MIYTSPLEILENTYALRILVVLKRKGPLFRSILYNLISKSTGAPRIRVDELIEAGLLEEKISTVPPFTKTVSLTEKGKKVAEKVAEIEEILREEER
ncbi:MAG: hypothetical protein QHH00_08330 [Methanomassiliicoccales archaeon]|jgi:DNA-binding HxlR family transcriptional regulator|nr:hypothetical protein [Methanomassiliicoccales archaeon]